MSDHEETKAFIKLRGILSFSDEELAQLFDDGAIPADVRTERNHALNLRTMRKLTSIGKRLRLHKKVK